MTNPPKIGILLSNLGSPATPDASGVRQFLGEFLRDPRVVELPRALWLPLLYGVILPLRSGKSARAYQKIWTDQGSPLVSTTRRQAELLQAHYQQQGLDIQVAWAMRYGTPGLAQGLNELLDGGCRRILLLPLYPQYAASTSGSNFDAATKALSRCRHLPEILNIGDFHQHPAYINAVAEKIRRYWQHNGRGDKLLLSFHGLPLYTHTRGDPYYTQCLKTGKLIAEALGLNEKQFEITFQSRFGRTEWLQPYTAERLAELGRQGIKQLDVACPGFVADCLETLEEIAIAGQASFSAAGGGELRYLPALNDDSKWINALGTISREALSGWI